MTIGGDTVRCEQPAVTAAVTAAIIATAAARIRAPPICPTLPDLSVARYPVPHDDRRRDQNVARSEVLGERLRLKAAMAAIALHRRTFGVHVLDVQHCPQPH